MKKDRYAVILLTIAGLAMLFSASCARRCKKIFKPPPPPASHRDKVAIEIQTDPNGTKHARMTFDNFYVHHGSNFLFYTDGCKLVFDTPPSKPDGLFARPPGSGTSVNVKIGDTFGQYEVRATCDGLPVEGNSPPVIIVDE